MSLIAELQRRNVIRMAGLYLVGAWLVVQVASTVLPMFGAPGWLPRSIVIVLVIGFLPALAFAWVFELTPAGLKRDDEVAPEQSIAPQTGRRMDRLIIAALVAALVFLAVDRFVLMPRREAAAPVVNTQAPAPAEKAADAPALGRQSIAVLPFTDLSPNKDQEYFSDGMAEEILNALAQVKGLKVAGRTSSFSYKGRNQDLRVIGRELGVAHVLEGSVRKQGDKVRITAQLILASDGSHLFSETYDGDLRDVFELQENIARAITDKLQVVLEGEQQQRLVPVATSSPEAYNLYLQANSIFERRDGPHMKEAVAALERAIALDPKFARAHSRLAAVYVVLPTYVGGDATQFQPKAIEHARAAIALDPTLAEPYAALGMVAGDSGKLVDELGNFETALRLDPDDPLSNFWYGLRLARAGYVIRGTARIEHALQIDPMLPNALRWRGNLLLMAGDAGAAEPYLRRARGAGLVIADRELARIEAMKGDRALAVQLWRAGSVAPFKAMGEPTTQAFAEGLYGDAAARARAVAMIDAFLATKPKQAPGLLGLVLLQMGEPAKALEVLNSTVSSDATDIEIAIWTESGRAIRALPGFQDYIRLRGYDQLWDVSGAPDLCVRKKPGEYVCR
ncbi:MAG: hypothetical protein NT117_05240 [Gammaproteobacteria bacterium]|nr:hypothetical protein [Gammaproteobacteria bacterium]